MTDDRQSVIGYVRQSRAQSGEDEHTSLSLNQQEESIREWAQRQGYRVAAIVRDHDESGRSMQRPGFEALKASVRPGTTVICYKYDRLARNLIGQELAVEELETLGVEVRSVTEPPGKLPRQIMGTIAEYYSDQLSERIAAIRASAAHAGRYTGAIPGYGYRRRDCKLVADPATGIARESRSGPIEQDPAAAPVVAEAYARVLAGESVNAVLRDLHARGIGRTWNTSTLVRMLRNPVYRGVIRYRGREVARGDYPPIVADEVWHAVQAKLERRPRIRWHDGDAPHWLEGYVYHQCGSRMYLVHTRGKRRRDGTTVSYPNYYCQRSSGLVRCDVGRICVSVRRLEPAVLVCLRADLAGAVPVERALAHAEALAGGQATAKRRAALEKQRERADQRRARAREEWLAEGDDLAAWEAEKRRHREEIARIDAELAALPAAPDLAVYRAAAAAIGEATGRLDYWTGDELRRLIDLVGRVIVGPDGVTVSYRPPFADFVATPTVVGW